jgi:hypothetical protein
VRKWDGETGAWDMFYHNDISLDVVEEYVSAFTVAELGQMLPEKINAAKNKGISSDLLAIQKGNFGKKMEWQVMYYDVHFENAPTEADARAKMLIYLLKHNLLSTF